MSPHSLQWGAVIVLLHSVAVFVRSQNAECIGLFALKPKRIRSQAGMPLWFTTYGDRTLPVNVWRTPPVRIPEGTQLLSDSALIDSKGGSHSPKSEILGNAARQYIREGSSRKRSRNCGEGIRRKNWKSWSAFILRMAKVSSRTVGIVALRGDMNRSSWLGCTEPRYEAAEHLVSPKDNVQMGEMGKLIGRPPAGVAAVPVEIYAPKTNGNHVEEAAWNIHDGSRRIIEKDLVAAKGKQQVINGLDMWKIRAVPAELVRILTVIDSQKTGTGFTKDIMVIWDDVRENLALKTCVEKILGFELSKELPTSDWKANKLTDAQIEYVGLDAIPCIRLYEVLMDTLDRKSVEIGQDIPAAWYMFNNKFGEPTRTKLGCDGSEVTWRTSD
ncbi:hypothetical protein DFH09DRAFT_1097101 [Mycena vulgaris]|nr:hypothetical protein DFH09DRAFT_1097101 [Mycena vulgaris]